MPREIMAEAKWDRLRELHAEGMGRNQIAREMGIQASCISRTAAYLGLTFDRAKIEAATRARLADLGERRSLLAEQFHDVAEDSLDRIYKPTTVYAFGGKENTYEEHTFTEAPATERRALVVAAGTATDRSLKLAPADVASNLDSAKSMLGNLGSLLTAYSRDLDEQDAATEDEPAGEA
ncbi:helix-turn-helix domain-containing protein [Streptomyces sp. NPDC102364]|uniref:helix-turn-helix domain-containing protein n=1 Tax=Streptomyces sp. NPDC102364 TaxID=3366161 RepID=UPI00381EF0DD